jgi:hypothetical protein
MVQRNTTIRLVPALSSQQHAPDPSRQAEGVIGYGGHKERDDKRPSG